jgi:xylulokinase
VIGAVSAEAARLTGLKAGIPVVAGGLDAACGALGAGVYRAGQTQEQGGQAGGMSICMDRCVADRRLILGRHVVPETWLLQGGSVGGGGALRWMSQELCAQDGLDAAEAGTGIFQMMSAQAERVAPGSNGLLFLPYMAGERSPIWNPRAKGVFYGLDYAKTRAHMIRACMEGVAYSLRHNLQTAEEAGASAGVLHAMGGSANSRVWTQIKADVTGRRIEVPSSDVATMLGAALLAGVGVGAYGGFEAAVRDTVQMTRAHEPDPVNAPVYDHGYGQYRRLYESLKEMMS